MASGCIVVAAQRTVTSHLIRDDFNGCLVTPGDPEKVAVKILQIFGNAKLARTIRKRARRTIVKTFSWDVIAIKLERKLQMIAKANN
jgi:glycosyltransferase involved in cell wall biosynthesis